MREHVTQTTLKPCPFCGHDGERGYELYIADFQKKKLPSIFCANPMCTCQITDGSFEGAIARWNRRVK